MFKTANIAALSLILSMALFGGSVDASPKSKPGDQAFHPFHIVKLKRVKTVHVDRSTLQVEYKVEVFSRFPETVKRLSGYASSRSLFVEVLDPEFELERVRPFKETRSEDTILVQINMRNGNLQPADLEVAFDDGSRAGFDFDENGVRDDVALKLSDRLPSETFENPHTTAFLIEAQERGTRELGSAELVESYLASARAIFCLSVVEAEVSPLLSIAELLQYDSPERVAFYRVNEENIAKQGFGLGLGFGSVAESSDGCDNP